MKRRTVWLLAGVLLSGSFIAGSICFQQQEKWPLRVGMTRDEVMEAFGGQYVGWSGSRIVSDPETQEQKEHFRKVMQRYYDNYPPTGGYFSKPDENGRSVNGYFEFDSNGRLVKWKIDGDSRPQWLEAILKPFGW